jgi:hypothetical protein
MLNVTRFLVCSETPSAFAISEYTYEGIKDWGAGPLDEV